MAGSSQTGKSFWVRDFLKRADQLYRRKPGPIVFFIKEWQPLFEDMSRTNPAIEFRREMPDMTVFKGIAFQNATVVIDDLLHQVTAETAELFTVGCSRYDVNIIFITQNLFDKNPHFRTISLNCKYFCIRKNPRDSSSIMYFARQVMPTNAKFFTKIYQTVTAKKAFSYIFFDADQNTPEQLRLRTNILLEDDSPVQCFFPVNV
ncbi:MAG: hypothetical protein AAGE99_05040 [Chlamydiota bacterium]